MIDRLLSGRGIPLASLMLVRQPVRLAVALAGISFAGILMFAPIFSFLSAVGCPVFRWL